MTLKLEGDLDILKMYLHIENEAASLRHSKLKSLNSENMFQGLNYFEHYRNGYSGQAPTISNQ